MSRLTDTPAEDRQDLAGTYQAALAARLDSIYRQLQRMANLVETARVQVHAGTVRGNFADLATNVLHDLVWGLANTGADQLARLAAEADLYRMLAAGAFDATPQDPAGPKTLEG